MAYQNNIPQATDDLSISQSDILNNFAAIDTFVNVNHVSFNGADQGKHSQITFPLGPLAGQPFTYGVGEIGLQSLNQLPTSVPDIWMTRGVGTAIPITGSLKATTGWTYLPSGVLIKWGSGTAAGAGNTIVTFPVAATNPVFSAVYTSLITPTSAITTYVAALSTTTITVNTSAAGTFNYFVIGA